MLKHSEPAKDWLAVAAQFKSKALNDRFLRMAEVKAKTGKSKSAIYREIAEGTFPSPVRTGKRSIAWRLSTIDAWMDAVERVEG